MTGILPINSIPERESLGENFSREGQYNSALEIFFSLLENSRNDNEKSRYYFNLSSTYYRMGDFESCENMAKKGLSILGEIIPTRFYSFLFAIVKELLLSVWFSLAMLFPFVNKNSEKKKRLELLFEVYKSLSMCYSLSKRTAFVWATIKLVRVSRQLGSSREQAIGSFGFASLFMTFPVFSFAGTFFSGKRKLDEKVYCSWIKGKGLQLLGYFHEFCGDYQASIRSFSNSVHIFQEENDIKELMMSLNGLEHSYHYSGDYTNSKLVIDQLFELAGKTNDSYFLGAVYLYYGRYYLHHANFSLARKYADMAVEISSRKKVWINNCFGLMLKGGVELAQGNNEEALRLYSIAEKEHRKKRFLKQYGNEIYILQAEALLRDFNAKKNSMRPEEYTAASAKLAQAAKVAAGKTRHWPTHYSNALRVYGATCFALGKTSQAIRYLVKSINHSQKYRLRFNHAKALYELGCVLEKSSPRQNPQKSFLEAYEILSELGISIYRDRVEKKLGKYYPKKYSQLPQPIEDISTNKRDISPDIEQKLETGLKYIHENYCFDISREGLSALLEISPNYLSTCFKIYTGEKIYEYITRLRVEEAARQLLNADKTIIEISFSVGFESLRTFNRAFRNILNMTPSEYRLKSK